MEPETSRSEIPEQHEPTSRPPGSVPNSSSFGRIDREHPIGGEKSDILRRVRLSWLLAHHSHVAVLVLLSFINGCLAHRADVRAGGAYPLALCLSFARFDRLSLFLYPQSSERVPAQYADWPCRWHSCGLSQPRGNGVDAGGASPLRQGDLAARHRGWTLAGTHGRRDGEARERLTPCGSDHADHLTWPLDVPLATDLTHGGSSGADAASARHQLACWHSVSMVGATSPVNRGWGWEQQCEKRSLNVPPLRRRDPASLSRSTKQVGRNCSSRLFPSVVCVPTCLGHGHILNFHAFGEIQAEGAIGRDMVIDQRCERPEILLSHLTEVSGFGQQALNE